MREEGKAMLGRDLGTTTPWASAVSMSDSDTWRAQKVGGRAELGTQGTDFSIRKNRSLSWSQEKMGETQMAQVRSW